VFRSQSRRKGGLDAGAEISGNLTKIFPVFSVQPLGFDGVVLLDIATGDFPGRRGGNNILWVRITGRRYFGAYARWISVDYKLALTKEKQVRLTIQA
jgi:hypothetical protein